MKTQTMRVVADQGADALFEISDDLETAIGKLEALAFLLARMADDAGDDALLFFSLKYSVEAIHDESNEVFHRLHDWRIANREKVGRA